LKRLKKYLLRGFVIVSGTLVLLYIIAFAYVSANKKKIISQVTAEISKKIGGKVTIGNVDLSFFRHFPKMSVALKQVSVTDSMYATHGHTFFKADYIFASVNIIKLIKKKPPLNGIRVEKGSIYLLTDSLGYSNEYLMRPKRDSVVQPSKEADKNEISFVELKDMRITMNNLLKNKLYDFAVTKLDVDMDYPDDKFLLFSVDADILVHNLAFKLSKGSYLKGKTFQGEFDMRFDKLKNQLLLDSIEVKLGGQPFTINARFDLKGPEPQFSLGLTSKELTYPVIKSLLPERIAKSLSKVDLDKPIDAVAQINGPLKGGEPLVNISWKAVKTELKTEFLDFQAASFTGTFTNEVVPGVPRYDPNSRISIRNFTANWNGLPVRSGGIDILNLSTPTLTCDLQSDFPLASLNEILGAGSLQLLSGDASLNITYQGPLERTTMTSSCINGGIHFKNGSMMYAPRKVMLTNVNGDMLFRNSDVFIENLQTEVLRNKIVMNGEARNLLTLINTDPGKVNINWRIFSPSLNLGAFTYLLGSRQKASSAPRKKNGLSGLATRIDNILDKGKLSVDLQATRLQYKKFEAGNVRANITLLEDSYIINQVSMNHAGGRMNLDGTVSVVKPGYLQAKIKANMSQVEVKTLFKAFDNFGQDGIKSENLEGRLSTKLNVSMAMNESGKMHPSSLSGLVDFSLKNGALNNFEPIKKLQNFLFKNRDFENVRFAELKNRLEFRNQEIIINRMEIQSSVLSLFVEGKYSTKGTTDISIQVPLNNLKKRAVDYKPENIGVQKKGGRSLFLRGRPGDDGNIKFNLDLFNKYQKDKARK